MEEAAAFRGGLSRHDDVVTSTLGMRVDKLEKQMEYKDKEAQISRRHISERDEELHNSNTKVMDLEEELARSKIVKKPVEDHPPTQDARM